MVKLPKKQNQQAGWTWRGLLHWPLLAGCLELEVGVGVCMQVAPGNEASLPFPRHTPGKKVR